MSPPEGTRSWWTGGQRRHFGQPFEIPEMFGREVKIEQEPGGGHDDQIGQNKENEEEFFHFKFWRVPKGVYRQVLCPEPQV